MPVLVRGQGLADAGEQVTEPVVGLRLVPAVAGSPPGRKCLPQVVAAGGGPSESAESLAEAAQRAPLDPRLVCFPGDTQCLLQVVELVPVGGRLPEHVRVGQRRKLPGGFA